MKELGGLGLLNTINSRPEHEAKTAEELKAEGK